MTELYGLVASGFDDEASHLASSTVAETLQRITDAEKTSLQDIKAPVNIAMIDREQHNRFGLQHRS